MMPSRRSSRVSADAAWCWQTGSSASAWPITRAAGDCRSMCCRLTGKGVLPRYLDLAAYEANGGVPYTQSSPALAALDASLRGSDWRDRQAKIAEADRRLRAGLRRLGFAIVARDSAAMPGVVTLALPEDVPPGRLAARMERLGYQLAHQSEYLVRHNWLQICLMGQW